MDCALRVPLGQKRVRSADGERGQEARRDGPGPSLAEPARRLAGRQISVVERDIFGKYCGRQLGG